MRTARLVLLLPPLLSGLPFPTVGSTPHCIKWRATSNCDPHGQREPKNDVACSQRISSGLSGFCECEDRRHVREVECGHHEFTCEEACAQDSSVDLSCKGNIDDLLDDLVAGTYVLWYF